MKNPNAARAQVLELLHRAGWPKHIGPNDKRQASHRYLLLSGRRVDSYFTGKHGFFVYDAALKLVVRGKTDDEAMMAMVEARESRAGSLTEHCVVGPNAQNVAMCHLASDSPAGTVLQG